MKPATAALKSRVIAAIIAREGGYSNKPSDSGGETMNGITEAVARANGYRGPMRDLPPSLTVVIYENKYWNALGLDAVGDLSLMIAEELADTGVNAGVSRAAEFLQRSLNVLNGRGKYYKDIKVDADIGPGTVDALAAFLKKRAGEGEIVMMRALNSLQGSHYITLAERREKDEDFVYGWLLNRVS